MPFGYPPQRGKSLLARLALAGALVGVLSGAGCRGSAGADAVTSSNVIVVAVADEPTTLNPILGYGTAGASLIFDGLVARDKLNELVPGLAIEMPAVSADGRTITVKLRDGVRFHDGRQLTAQDVVFTYQALLDPRVNTPLRAEFDMLAGVTAVDRATVVFQLTRSDPAFLHRLTLGIVCQDALAGQEIGQSSFNHSPIGTGPYRVESWTAGERIVLTAHREYFAGKPANDRVVVRFITDEAARARQARAESFDLAELTPAVAAEFDDELPGYRVERVPSADYRAVALPLADPVTGDLAIRRALSLALDRKSMINEVLGGAGLAAFGPIPPSSRYFDPTVTGSPLPNLAAAAALLDGAGWLPGEGGFRVRNGQRARFTLGYPTADRVSADLAMAVAADAEKIGLQVVPEGLDRAAIEQHAGTGASIVADGTPYDPDLATYQRFASRFAGQAGLNPAGYASATTDRALQAGRDDPDPLVRAVAYQEVQRQLAADLPWVFLVYLKHTYLVRELVSGVNPRVEPHDHGMANGLAWNINTWTKR